MIYFLKFRDGFVFSVGCDNPENYIHHHHNVNVWMEGRPTPSTLLDCSVLLFHDIKTKSPVL